MQERADLPLEVRRRFLTGRVCLDFAHTGGEGALSRWELLVSGAEISHWLSLVLRVDVAASDTDLAEVQRVRNAIWSLAYGAANGAALTPGPLAVVNEAARLGPPGPTLLVDGTVVPAPLTAAQACSVLARDAIDLLGGPLRERIRVCASPDCGFLLVDTSRPGERRWCSMARCGNLAKVRRHRGSRTPVVS